MVDFGAFVDVGLGKDGLMPTALGGVLQPGTGDSVTVRVVNFQEAAQRLTLALVTGDEEDGVEAAGGARAHPSASSRQDSAQSTGVMKRPSGGDFAHGHDKRPRVPSAARQPLQDVGDDRRRDGARRATAKRGAREDDDEDRGDTKRRRLARDPTK